MPGLVPGIHVLRQFEKVVDGIATRACPSCALTDRRKSGIPDLRVTSPAMTVC